MRSDQLLRETRGADQFCATESDNGPGLLVTTCMCPRDIFAMIPDLTNTSTLKFIFFKTNKKKHRLNDSLRDADLYRSLLVHTRFDDIQPV